MNCWFRGTYIDFAIIKELFNVKEICKTDLKLKKFFAVLFPIVFTMLLSLSVGGIDGLVVETMETSGISI